MIVRIFFQTVLMLLILLPASNADPIPEMVQFLDNEITPIHQALLESSESSELACSIPQSDETLYLRNFWLRVRGHITFSVPGIASVDLIPEVELLWQRPLPAGWSNYQH